MQKDATQIETAIFKYKHSISIFPDFLGYMVFRILFA